MNNDDTLKVEVQMELERISELQKNKEEFDKLGLNIIGLRNFLIILVPYGLLMVVYAFFEIESELFQILCLVFFNLGLNALIISAM